MKGNSTQLVVAVGRGNLTEDDVIAELIAPFVLGAAAGQVLAGFTGGRHLTWILVAVAVLLAIAAVFLGYSGTRIQVKATAASPSASISASKPFKNGTMSLYSWSVNTAKACRSAVTWVSPPTERGFADTVPIVTANWGAEGDKWTLPVGAGVGRVIKIGGKLPLKSEVGAQQRATPDGHWQQLTEAAVVF